jgi:hypothetical protein
MRGLLSSIVINKSQFLSLIRNAISFVGGIAVGKGWITADTFTFIAGGAATLTNVLWGFLSHTKFAQLMELEKMTEVKQIVVSNEANGKFAAAASSPQHEKIVKE